MIHWPFIARALARLAAASHPARLLSITVALPYWPVPDPAALDDWCVWQRPQQGLCLFGAGGAFVAESAGAGRFAALHAAQRGLAAAWRYRGAPPRAFLGFAFAPDGGAPLPNARLWVPELLLAEQDGRFALTLSCSAGEASMAPARWRALWRKWTTTTAVPLAPTFVPASRAHSAHEPPPKSDRPLAHSAVLPAPTFASLPNPLADAAFLARGRAALRAIRRGDIDKLVLTRAIRCKAERPGHIASVLNALAAHHPSCATFGVGYAGQAFVGASPETLVELWGERVAVDALAGTAWQAHVLDTDKNRREHDYVAHAVAKALAAHCRDIVVPAAPEVMHLYGLTHLRRRVTARRPSGLGVFDLVAHLHPTPAVGGAPTVSALDWLERHGDQRGAWYTGGIGWIDATGDCDIAVALRCGLIERDNATLYAGAGFVAGSDPEQELAETEAKFTAMREALAAATSPARAAGSPPASRRDAA